MKDLKKRNIIERVFFFTTLLLALAAVASAQDHRTCTMAGRAGEYGFTWTGTLIFPSGPVPFAVVGRITFDAKGTESGTQTIALGSEVVKSTFKGTYTVNSHCTGTLTVNSYDTSGNRISTVTADTVSVDNMRETRAIMTSLTLPDGTSLPVIETFNAKKLFPDSDNEQ
jgi:hypothetical protein